MIGLRPVLAERGWLLALNRLSTVFLLAQSNAGGTAGSFVPLVPLDRLPLWLMDKRGEGLFLVPGLSGRPKA